MLEIRHRLKNVKEDEPLLLQARRLNTPRVVTLEL
jgi:hypothetical protein